MLSGRSSGSFTFRSRRPQFLEHLGGNSFLNVQKGGALPKSLLRTLTYTPPGWLYWSPIRLDLPKVTLRIALITASLFVFIYGPVPDSCDFRVGLNFAHYRFALKTLARRCPIPVDLQVHAKKRLPEPVEVSAYYFVAEALTNAARHAHASAVGVEAEIVGDLLRVTVRDDGVGGGASLAGGSGLAGLKDRVEALGGRIVLHSPPGAGTSLRAELPLTATNDGVTSR